VSDGKAKKKGGRQVQNIFINTHYSCDPKVYINTPNKIPDTKKELYILKKTYLGVFNFESAASGINVCSIQGFFGSSSYIYISKRMSNRCELRIILCFKIERAYC